MQLQENKHVWEIIKTTVSRPLKGTKGFRRNELQSYEKICGDNGDIKFLFCGAEFLSKVDKIIPFSMHSIWLKLLIKFKHLKPLDILGTENFENNGIGLPKGDDFDFKKMNVTVF